MAIMTVQVEEPWGVPCGLAHLPLLGEELRLYPAEDRKLLKGVPQGKPHHICFWNMS